MNPDRIRRVQRLKRANEMRLQEARLDLQQAAVVRDRMVARREQVLLQAQEWERRLHAVSRNATSLDSSWLQWTSEWLDAALNGVREAGRAVKEADQAVADRQRVVLDTRGKRDVVQNRLDELCEERDLVREREAMAELDDLTLGRWEAA